MGMDYQYAGSASYDRFGQEVDLVAKMFGGVQTPEFVQHQLAVKNGTVDWWMGKQHKFTGRKYQFPKDTNEVFIKWVENPYAMLTKEETLEVHSVLVRKYGSIPIQILNEFETLVTLEECWYIT